MVTAGCGKSQAEKLVNESLLHTAAAVDMMEAANGNLEDLIGKVATYRVAHHAEFKKLRKDGELALQALDEKERARIEGAARRRGQAHLHRLETLSHRFRNPKLALRVVRPLIIAGTPRPSKRRPSLLPSAPPLDLPHAGTPSGHRH